MVVERINSFSTMREGELKKNIVSHAFNVGPGAGGIFQWDIFDEM